PTETEEDLRAIVSLSQKVKRLAKAKVNLGLAHFTPKAHTPFQWMPGSDIETIRGRLRVVREAARLPGLTARFNDPGVSFVEALLSRGDRRLGRLILEVFKRGARFEAWNDHFNLNHWQEAMAKFNFDQEELIRARDLEETLPWDHLFCGVNRDYLIKELQKAHQAQATLDCRQSGCQGCGACHDSAQIDLAESPLAKNDLAEHQADHQGHHQDDHAAEASGEYELNLNQGPVKLKAQNHQGLREFRYLARFTKDGAMTLLGHLEMVEAIKRAFKRSGLELAMSQGFHPHPKVSFLTALPLGVTSLDECLIFSLKKYLAIGDLTNRLNLPRGLALQSLKALPSQGPKPRALATRWLIIGHDPVFQRAPLFSEARLSYTDPKRGLRDFSLADYILEASNADPFRALLTIKIGLEGTPKPIETAKVVWSLESGFTARLIKLSTILDTDPPVQSA
ncbi:MAG: TIGR03936 family radical SAM-associated protein, partial [Deltaproteobacteria bacterium]|nr:TIGR03936 family radical SAM-associated protein [Deltaproteobacteria bacterium]